MHIFFSVGEPSGDLHGANLIERLRRARPDLEAVGYGGPRMAAAGCRLHADLTQLAVMWFSRVLLNLHRFLYLLWQADRYFRRRRPDAVVMIDYPGFNWWIARRAKAHGIPVYYYGTPQLWGWASWRVRKMRRLVDHVLTKLPFEPAWYGRRGVTATYVGHPYFDQLSQQRLDEPFVSDLRQRPGPLVAILPGSRTQEVTSNLKWLLRAAARVRQEVPDARLAVACFSERHAELARRCVDEQQVEADVHVGRTMELIAAARCALACSGSVSLELLYHATPSVVLYWISPLAYRVQRHFRRARYITLVNLLAVDGALDQTRPEYDPDAPGAERVPMPEYLTCEDRSSQMAAWIVRWLTDPQAYEQTRGWLEQLRAAHARPGASEAAADYILRSLDAARPPIADPAHAHAPRLPRQLAGRPGQRSRAR